jgi:hypothetical protein
VVRVISRSTFDLQSVLDTLLECTSRPCQAENGSITIREGDVFRFLASRSLDSAFAVYDPTPVGPGAAGPLPQP